MKKVGLITYYGDNYGGVLQAYALQRTVEEQDFACELISNEFLGKKSRVQKLKSKVSKLLSPFANQQIPERLTGILVAMVHIDHSRFFPESPNPVQQSRLIRMTTGSL